MSNTSLIGLSADLIPTPALVVDATLLEKNIQGMKDFLQQGGVAIRPHSKTHKSPMIAHMQMQAGAIGVCCATIGEAEAMVYAGIQHILLTSQVYVIEKVRRVVSLGKMAEVIVTVDNLENLEQIIAESERIGTQTSVLVEVDVGMGRCGTRTMDQTVLLAQVAHDSPSVVFKGIYGYEGHAVFIEDREKRMEAGRAANHHVVTVAQTLREKGLPVEIVSAAGTGTYDIASAVPGITEIQAGSYVFMDGTYGKLGLPFEQSLTVLSTVISCPAPDTFVLDVGMKGISVERFLPDVLHHEHLKIVSLSESHATGSVLSGHPNLKAGEKIHLVPSHCCTTVSLYDELHVVRNGLVEAIWPITARGPY